MSVFKCKMCGGTLNITEGSTVAECEYCGTRQTVPSLDNEKKVNLFTRANRLRAACEFDKAYGVYESIVAEFPEEAEAYWGLILCKYGIEYVDDPRTGKKIPTCHRSSFDGVFDDANFELVMEYSDSLSRAVYREEAKEIERLRTRILEVSSKEEPYDIFICYKETDENGERTIDSVLAQNVYDVLTEKGYKVFFSRITLEDKLGQEYEPYIFAALNSAKVMLAFGTDYEYYNAVWVKNEWSRYLGLIEKGEKKVLIPCYKGIDAYDMPAEFKRLQAQDMGKIGAVQDLVRGIEKIIGKKGGAEDANATTVANPTASPASQVAPILKRAFMFLEEGNWSEAENYCEKVLDLDPENGEAYLGKLMADLKARKGEELVVQNVLVSENPNYQKALRYGIETYNEELKQIQEKDNKVKRKAEQVIAALLFPAVQRKKEKLQSQLKERAELEETIPKLADKMSRLQSVYDSLQSDRQKLGAFALKEKRKIDEQLSEAYSELTATTQVFEQKKARYQELPAQDILCKELDQGENQYKEFLESLKEDTLNVTYSEAISAIQEESTYKIIKNMTRNDIGVFLPVEILRSQNGDLIEFGHYPQKEKHEVTPIKWRILCKMNNHALLISEKALDAKPYNNGSDWFKIGWEECSLREWLNSTFYMEAFDKKERTLISEITADEDLYKPKKSDQKNDPIEKVFLLNRQEAEQYFHSKVERICSATPYCFAQGAFKNIANDNIWWWLRSPNSRQKDRNVVDYHGNIGILGEDNSVLGDHLAVRPSLWISLEDFSEVEVGEVYEGRVTRIMSYGAFLEILPGREGLLHISKMSKRRVKKVEDIMNVGDIVEVKVKEIDSQNRINLLRTNLLD